MNLCSLSYIFWKEQQFTHYEKSPKNQPKNKPILGLEGSKFHSILCATTEGRLISG